MVTLIASLKETFGPGESGATGTGSEELSAWRAVLNALTPAFTQLASPIGQAVAMKMMSPAPGSSANTRFSAFPKGPSTPEARSATNPPTLEGGTGAAPAASATEGTEASAQAELLQLAGQIGPLLLNALNQGRDGASFADSLTALYGGLAYEQISALGKDGIMAALQVHPQLWPQLAPIQPRLEQFIDEFIVWGQVELEEEHSGAEPDAATTMEEPVSS